MYNRENLPEANVWSPKYLPAHLSLLLLRAIVALPDPCIRAAGSALGFIAFHLLKKRVFITRRNLEICYPELSSEEREKLVRKHFHSVGMGILETGMAWFWSKERFKKHIVIDDESLRNIEEAKKSGKGTIVLTAHFMHLEIMARAYGEIYPGVGVYKPNRNPVFERAQIVGRTWENIGLVTNHDIKGMIKALREGHSLWYAGDQDYRTKSRVFVPFFGFKCLTVTGITTLCKVRNAQAVLSYTIRDDRTFTWHLYATPALPEFPSTPEEDCARYNRLIEDAIRKAPEQYMWLHKRFATRPDPSMKNVYDPDYRPGTDE